MSQRLTLRWRLRGLAAALVFPPLVHLVSLTRLTGWIERRSVAGDSPRAMEAALADWVDRLLTALPPPWRRTA